jgi:hypothetical protein
MSFPVADVLRPRGVPYFFATGYGLAVIDPSYRDSQVIKKPFMASDHGARDPQRRRLKKGSSRQ